MGATASQSLSELHGVPQKQSVDSEYYVTEILEKSLLPGLSRAAITGSVQERKIVPELSTANFQQDGAPAHSSKEAQDCNARGTCLAYRLRTPGQATHRTSIALKTSGES